MPCQAIRPFSVRFSAGALDYLTVSIAYESVIPYFEKALELSPDEKNTLATLRELYFKLRNQKPEYQQRYDEIKQKLEAQ